MPEEKKEIRKTSSAPKKPAKVVKKKYKKPDSTGKKAAKGVFAVIGRSILTVLVVLVITGSIVTVAMSAIILKLVDTDYNTSLDSDDLSFTSVIMVTDYATGEQHESQRIYGEENSDFINIEEMSSYLGYAAVSAEDKRFYEHAGVDWLRTIMAAVNEFIPILPSRQGGSTLDQQVIKNVTGNNEPRVDRKVQEIFSALNLDKKYSKEDILEAYLNLIRLGNNTRGVQAASQYYFAKDAKDLSISESACLIAITKNPTRLNPIANPEDNTVRREWILNEMFLNGYITQAELDSALAEELKFNLNDEGVKPKGEIQSYFTDAVIEESIRLFMDEFGLTRELASESIFTKGYTIYSTMDARIQNVLEYKYANEEAIIFRTAISSTPVQSAAVVTDTGGRVLGLVGGTGPKDNNRVWNRATMTKRHPGSTIKPVSVYSLAIERNIATYSSMFTDKVLNFNDGGTIWSPRNYYSGNLGRMTVDMAFRRSVNTIAVQVEELVTPKESFDFMSEQLEIDSLVAYYENLDGTISTDIALSPMSLGALTQGVTPLEWTGAYQIFMNGGFFTRPYLIDSIVDAKGNTVYETDKTPIRVLGEDTAYIVNKLMQNVVYETGGTGAYARAVPTRVAAKTGTSNDNKDLWFCGGTADYVLSVWIGHDRPREIKYSAPYTPVLTWTELMKGIEEVAPTQGTFPETASVVALKYCSISGEEARDTCAIGGTGYYKKNSPPPLCTGHFIDDEDFYVDDEGKLRDGAGNLIDADGNIIDEEGNIIAFREDITAENPFGENSDEESSDEESSGAPATENSFSWNWPSKDD